MAVTPTQFRTNFPAFADEDVYTPGQVQFWLDMAALMMDTVQWLTYFDLGSQLFAAHMLSLEFNAQTSAAFGANPGSVVGPQSAGAVDKVSYARDNSAAMLKDAGHWNLSVYGLRWKWLANMIGAKPIQVGVPPGGSNYYGVNGASGAWNGPWYANVPNPSD